VKGAPPDPSESSAESSRNAPDRLAGDTHKMRPPALSQPDGVPADVIRRGRRWATIAFLSLVALFTLTQAGQITRQVQFPTVVPNATSCEQALFDLAAALERARSAGEATLDQDTALARFRAALDPEWAGIEGSRANCASTDQRRSLDALERLRYAEEHAVRREAASLAALRRQVAADLAKHTNARVSGGDRP
jgi:hypothetical protein